MALKINLVSLSYILIHIILYGKYKPYNQILNVKYRTKENDYGRF